MSKPKRFKWKNTSLLSQYYNKVQKTSTFSNIAVKVQAQVFLLDKVILAMKSAFFEKLFTSDFDDRKHDEVEIHCMEAETFLSIIEHIYGTVLAINERNFATLFIAMDYLQMQIDTQFFTDFLVEKDELLEESEVFKLYHYVSMLSEFESLAIQIRRHFSQNINRIYVVPELLSLTPTMLIELLSWRSKDYNFRQTYRISEICCEWICHDFQNRLPRIVDLVNAVKRRFRLIFAISNENYKPFEEPDEQRQKERVKKYFHKLLNFNAKTKFEAAANNSEILSEHNKSKSTNEDEKLNNSLVIREQSDDAKWKTYFEHGQFCDISIQAGDEIFQLHRIKLHMEIPYFRNLLSQSPNLNNHTLDAVIDRASFGEIVKSIYYYKEIDLVDESQIHRLFCCSEILQMKKISQKIHKYVIKNWKTMKDNFIDILPSVLRDGEDVDYDMLVNVIEDHWEEICDGLRLTKMSFDTLEFIVSLPGLRLDNEHSLLNICCKWIHHDVENRYQLIPELALAINRNSMADYQEYSSLVPDDLCSEQQIENQLQSILLKTQLVSISTEPLASSLSEALTPCFMISNGHKVTVVNAHFDEIISIPFSKKSIEEEDHFKQAAALIGDNLFLFFLVNKYEYSFQVYNLCSKKITSLTFDWNKAPHWPKFRLLNCKNELYLHLDNRGEDHLFKYSYRLNRWIKFPIQKFKANNQQVCTSDGKTFYRFCRDLDLRHLDNIEMYDLEKRSWIKLPVFSEHVDADYKFYDVTVVDGNLCFLFCWSSTASYNFISLAVTYQQEAQTWRVIAKSGREQEDPRFYMIKGVKDSLMYITAFPKRLLYSFSITNRKWQMEKRIQLESDDWMWYNNVVSIHSVS